ncbi:putative endopeptidase [Corynebacterium deserti GIMN1.010]|uniref:Putative endopeptidase n=1 Tax=Corynebacterium deserti GIMN1.010 TaxID=931089 RepID=A0A0M4CYX3_9CORY|nr:C40 family peptidase [Corynebacterium deserti]ALC06370.1 putative endopeptidase [Corynebacterium deserti GIMN1.010]
MGKHRRSNSNAARNAVAASAVAVGATAAIATPAQAAEVVVPNTNYSVEVAGIENVQGLNNVPGIDQWIPSLANQASPTAYAAVVDAPAVEAQAAPATTTGQAIVDAARTKIGAPYGWGAAGPNAFDCSGLTSWAYSQVGKSIPRTSQAQAAQGTPVAYSDLQPGDIVAFYSGATHVGIYTGNGTVVHALNSNTPLSENSLDYMPFHSAVRF